MNLFSDRMILAQKYEAWLLKNPIVADCPLSVLAFLDSIGALKDIKDLDGIIPPAEPNNRASSTPALSE